MPKTRIGPQTLLYPMPAVLVGAPVGGKPNFMTAAWCGIACLEPPAISVALNRMRHALRGIQDKKTFSINVPSCNLVKKVDFCGIYSGKKRDKSHVFNVFYGNLKTAPLIEQCPINLECKVIHTVEIGSHHLIIGEILETHVTEACITDGKADPTKIDPLVYSPAVRCYQRLGEIIAHAFQVGKEASTNP